MRTIVLAVCLLFMTASASLAAVTDGLYKGRLGPYNMVVSNDITIAYPGRERGLEVRATYPQKGDHLPIFIFSHGAFGSGQAYEPLATYIASHGYVVLQPTHTDSIKYGNMPLIRNPLSFKNWNERPKEISYLIDKLGLVVEQIPALGSMMDQDKIALGGHSFGAHTAQLLAGMTVKRPLNFTNDKRKSYRDDRICAFTVISPQGTGHIIDKKSYETMDRPMLFITGTNDKSPVNDNPYTWRLEAFLFAPLHDKYLLLIDGAYHGFGGISGRTGWKGAGPENPDDLNAVRSSTLAFLDAYVKDQSYAKSWLDGGSLRKASGGLIQMTSK